MPMGGSAWDRNRNRREDNVDRSRWYGIRPGDEVEMTFAGVTHKGEVVRLHTMDNNGCTIRVRGREMKGVCEWLTVLKKVEDK